MSPDRSGVPAARNQDDDGGGSTSTSGVPSPLFESSPNHEIYSPLYTPPPSPRRPRSTAPRRVAFAAQTPAPMPSQPSTSKPAKTFDGYSSTPIELTTRQPISNSTHEALAGDRTVRERTGQPLTAPTLAGRKASRTYTLSGNVDSIEGMKDSRSESAPQAPARLPSRTSSRHHRQVG